MHSCAVHSCHILNEHTLKNYIKLIIEELSYSILKWNAGNLLIITSLFCH